MTATKQIECSVCHEEVLSEYETELSDKAWDSWAASDTEREIEKQFGIEIDDTGERFCELFYTVAERANEYWECDGTDMYIHVDRVVEELTIDDLVEYGLQFAATQPTEKCTVEDMQEHQIEYDETISVNGTNYLISVSYDVQGIQFGVETQHGVGLGMYRDRKDAIAAITKEETNEE